MGTAHSTASANSNNSGHSNHSGSSSSGHLPHQGQSCPSNQVTSPSHSGHSGHVSRHMVPVNTPIGTGSSTSTAARNLLANFPHHHLSVEELRLLQVSVLLAVQHNKTCS